MAPDEEPESNDSGVYGHDAREDLAENDEISPQEEAFMEGYDETVEEDEETENDAYNAAFGGEETEEKPEGNEPAEEEEYDEY